MAIHFQWSEQCLLKWYAVNIFNLIFFGINIAVQRCISSNCGSMVQQRLIISAEQLPCKLSLPSASHSMIFVLLENNKRSWYRNSTAMKKKRESNFFAFATLNLKKKRRCWQYSQIIRNICWNEPNFCCFSLPLEIHWSNVYSDERKLSSSISCAMFVESLPNHMSLHVTTSWKVSVGVAKWSTISRLSSEQRQSRA